MQRNKLIEIMDSKLCFLGEVRAHKYLEFRNAVVNKFFAKECLKCKCEMTCSIAAHPPYWTCPNCGIEDRKNAEV